MADDAVQRIGDYEVLAPLGAGGMGRVYKVRNVISNREEAMKVLLPDIASDPDLAARFMAEIRTLAGLEHPGIAQLRTAFQIQNQFVMVMEFVEGTTLEKLAAQIRIPLDKVVDYGTQVLAALSYAHMRGVTHRDIKPANIMITSHGLAKLMDFGIAKSTNDMQLTRPGTTMGSVYYMSPEQVRGGTIDARSDLYSLGVTLYEMLTGRKPFQADTSYSVLNAQLNDPPTPPIEVNPAISPQLNEVVLRAMAKRPEDRFQTAEEFGAALKVLAHGQPGQMPYVAPEAPAFEPMMVNAAPVRPTERLVVQKSRRGLWIGMGAATAILALVAVAWLLPHVLATHAGQRGGSAPYDDKDSGGPAASVKPDGADSVDASKASEPAVAASEPSAVPASPAKPAMPTGKAEMASSSPAQTGKRERQPYASASASNDAAASSPARTPTQEAAPAAAAPSGPSRQEIREARDRLMNLDARAESASTGVEHIRAQQQSQGLDMRGDIVTAMTRMRRQLQEAERAIGEDDLTAANEYMDRADRDIAVLEKFLGR